MADGAPGSLWHTRLAGEWTLLEQSAALNPGRIRALSQEDSTFRFTLHHVPAPALDANPKDRHIVATHAVEVVFPEHFPAAPLELSLKTPVWHPNVHPLTGFVCLWQGHRASHNIELALHKLLAILSWQVLNRDGVHVMQPDALAAADLDGQSLQRALRCAPLIGTATFQYEPATPSAVLPRRRRLL